MISNPPQKLHLPIPAYPSIFALQVIPNAVANKTVNVGLVQLSKMEPADLCWVNWEMSCLQVQFNDNTDN